MKEEFKKFVKNNPNLIDYVENKKMTWQQFYELYDLYGEDNSIWNKFKDNTSTNSTSSNNIVNTIKDVVTLFKGIDLNTIQRALTTADKAIEALKDFGKKENNNVNSYEERPRYKYFED